MKKELIIATTNKGKLAEFKSLLADYEILSNADIHYTEEIEETGATLRENAWLKANAIHQFCGKAVMAEDSGLFVPSINGEPGIYSARYAGLPSNAVNNMNLLLQKLKGNADRSAYFKTVVCYQTATETQYFEGKIEGIITHEMHGDKGFGYDPIFIPYGFDLTFAELDVSVKNKISHRAIAIRNFIDFLKQS